MNCNEALELITPAVDESLALDLRTRFNAHLEHCAQCRKEFQLELMTKQLVRQRIPMLHTPNDVTAQIISSLSQIQSKNNKRRFSLSNIFDRPLKKSFIATTAIAFAVVLFLLIPLHPQHSHARPENNDVIDQTYNNFGKVIKGSFTSGVVSEDNRVVENYFAANASFTVQVPKLKQCKLVSGSLSRYKDERIAHLIYQEEQNYIYIYQTCLRSVMEGNSLQLSDYAKNELQNGNSYVEQQCSNCTLVIWTVDSTLCCAVSNIDKPQLLAFFKDSK